jgi:hypothetical protein
MWYRRSRVDACPANPPLAADRNRLPADVHVAPAWMLQAGALLCTTLAAEHRPPKPIARDVGSPTNYQEQECNSHAMQAALARYAAPWAVAA